MGHLATSAIFIGLVVPHACLAVVRPSAVVDARVSTAAHFASKPESQIFLAWRVAQSTDVSGDPTTTTATGAQSSAPMNGSAVVCQTLQSAALANDLPLGFFARLIWQESRFDAQAVSPAGAQGVAQFMPGTAAWVRLANPFDATEAINKSAEFLRN